MLFTVKFHKPIRTWSMINLEKIKPFPTFVLSILNSTQIPFYLLWLTETQ